MVTAFLVGAAGGLACFSLGLIIGEKFAEVKLTRKKKEDSHDPDYKH